MERRALIPPLLGASLALAAGWWLEGLERFQVLRTRMQVQQVPAPLLDTGVLGTLLQQGDLVDDQPGEEGSYLLSEAMPDEDEPLVFRRKALVGSEFYGPASGYQSTFPESRLPATELDCPDWLVISVAVEPRSLESLHEHYQQRLERRAQLTLYRGDQELYTSRAGFKLHGGHSRGPGYVHSYRLHLRDRYGDLAFPEGMLLGGNLDPLQNLIVRREVHGRVTCNMGYDVFRQLGLEVPHTEPALFYLNGERMGIYYLTEHFNNKQQVSRFGHEDFLLFRQRGSDSQVRVDQFTRLLMWVRDNAQTMTWQAADRYIDMESLTRYLVAIAFCGTIDWEQGAAVLDLTDPDDRWTWIPWDLDRGLWEDETEGGGPSFGLIHDDPRQKRTSLPAVLFRALIENDPSYPAYVASLAMDALNHRLTPRFLKGRIAHHEGQSQSIGVRLNLSSRRRFFADRHRAVLEDLAARTGLPEVHKLRIIAKAKEMQVLVDGHLHPLPYEGHYYAGTPVQISQPGGQASRSWIVNGSRDPSPDLNLEIAEETLVRFTQN